MHSPSVPTTQSDGTGSVAGDIWLDRDDTENFPVYPKWSGSAWVKLMVQTQVNK